MRHARGAEVAAGAELEVVVDRGGGGGDLAELDALPRDLKPALGKDGDDPLTSPNGGLPYARSSARVTIK